MSTTDTKNTEAPRPSDTGLSTVINLCDNFGGAVTALCWISGVVLASGWWKLLAVVFPPYAIYLVVERILLLSGFIS